MKSLTSKGLGNVAACGVPELCYPSELTLWGQAPSVLSPGGCSGCQSAREGGRDLWPAYVVGHLADGVVVGDSADHSLGVGGDRAVAG